MIHALPSCAFAIRDTILVPYPDTVWSVARESASRPDWVWGLIGVGVGFALAELANLIRHVLRIRRLRIALRHECESLLAQVPDFIDNCEQMIASLRNHRILPGPAVRS